MWGGEDVLEENSIGFYMFFVLYNKKNMACMLTILYIKRSVYCENKKSNIFLKEV